MGARDVVITGRGAVSAHGIGVPALRDALLAVDIPFIEIHLSNTFAREEFRHASYFSDVAEGCVIGLGAMGYELALHAAAQMMADAEED